MKKVMIDLLDIRTNIKNGIFHVFVKKNKVYLEDSQNGECIMICDLKEISEQKLFS